MQNQHKELNHKQLEAVKAISGPVLVLAGAGSGKTNTLTHRIAYLVSEQNVLPHQILAVTFTNKAAAELRQRAASLLKQDPKSWITWRGFGSSPALGTFHSICVRILREDAESLGYKKSFVIYDTSDQKAAMRDVMRMEGISPKDVNPKTVLAMISRAKNEMLTPEKFGQQARGPAEQTASQLYNSYQNYLKNNHAMDFDDLLMQCVLLFQKYPNVLKKYQDMWHYIMIDEYQDTNTVQYQWARLLAGLRQNLFVVGDDWQGIYSWRGATIRNILEFEQDFPASNVVRLEQNYRSTVPIVELGNSIIAGNSGQMKKKLWTEKSGNHNPEVLHVIDEVREAEMVLEKINYIANTSNESKQIDSVGGNSESGDETLSSDNTDNEISYDYESEQESSGILDKILGTMGKGNASKKSGKAPSKVASMRASKGVPYDIGQQKINWNNFAVLYRTNAQSRALEEALLKYGVPYRLIGGIRFYERKEIKDTLAYLRFLLNPNDSIALARIINEPVRGIGERTLSVVQELSRTNNQSLLTTMLAIEDLSNLSSLRANAIKQFALVFERALKSIDELSIADLIDLLLVRSKYFEYLKSLGDEGVERIENIEELKNVAKKFEPIKGTQGLEAFLEEVALIADVDSFNPEHGQALTLMTLHAAKGLEFETVFLVGLEEGLLPHSNSIIDPQQLEEERRLCYVGITRARERLFFIHTRQRAMHGSIVSNVPSRFLSELNEDHVQFLDESEW